MKMFITWLSFWKVGGMMVVTDDKAAKPATTVQVFIQVFVSVTPLDTFNETGQFPARFIPTKSRFFFPREVKASPAMFVPNNPRQWEVFLQCLWWAKVVSHEHNLFLNLIKLWQEKSRILKKHQLLWFCRKIRCQHLFCPLGGAVISIPWPLTVTLQQNVSVLRCNMSELASLHSKQIKGSTSPEALLTTASLSLLAQLAVQLAI